MITFKKFPKPSDGIVGRGAGLYYGDSLTWRGSAGQ